MRRLSVPWRGSGCTGESGHAFLQYLYLGKFTLKGIFPICARTGKGVTSIILVHGGHGL
ncbi:hypothetical protein HMPREF3038_02538 [Akkermansia sp. KLE1797]|nr:hypothetical protein HMPREF3038_02538 [Akkermansia sp. KLE1797]KXU52968.1 hypothetical protein HMPREF3039_02897 [Akkermansia sp. KLE1798]KZA03021.1 hypothetical protein HMPREF1326_03290 [Akkermansia sp. KLE1605]